MDTVVRMKGKMRCATGLFVSGLRMRDVNDRRSFVFVTCTFRVINLAHLLPRHVLPTHSAPPPA